MKLKSDKLIQTSIHRINHLICLDWDLKCVNTRYVMHAFHPYLGKYIAHIPHYLISCLTKK